MFTLDCDKIIQNRQYFQFVYSRCLWYEENIFETLLNCSRLQKKILTTNKYQEYGKESTVSLIFQYPQYKQQKKKYLRERIRNVSIKYMKHMSVYSAARRFLSYLMINLSTIFHYIIQQNRRMLCIKIKERDNQKEIV